MLIIHKIVTEVPDRDVRAIMHFCRKTGAYGVKFEPDINARTVLRRIMSNGSMEELNTMTESAFKYLEEEGKMPKCCPHCGGQKADGQKAEGVERDGQ